MQVSLRMKRITTNVILDVYGDTTQRNYSTTAELFVSQFWIMAVPIAAPRILQGHVIFLLYRKVILLRKKNSQMRLIHVLDVASSANLPTIADVPRMRTRTARASWWRFRRFEQQQRNYRGRKQHQ